MRDFKAPGGTLWRLSPAAKVLYAGFNLLTVLGFLTSLALYWGSMGAALGTTASYWIGDPPDSPGMNLEKSPRYLLELTHQHLFSMPVVLLVLGHLFLLARGGNWKVAVVAFAIAITVLHVAGPWVIWAGGAAFAWWMPLTGIPYVAVYLFMALWPMPDLVTPPPAEE